MYSSRPRYSRYSSDFDLPQNYSGNAFRKIEEPVDAPEERVEDNARKYDEMSQISREDNDTHKEESVSINKDMPYPKRFGSGFGLDISRIFKGGIGSEELLIVSLILLLAQSENNNDDIVLLLALLLFIK